MLCRVGALLTLSPLSPVLSAVRRAQRGDPGHPLLGGGEAVRCQRPAPGREELHRAALRPPVDCL